MDRRSFLQGTALGLAGLGLSSASGRAALAGKKVLFFTKSSGFEHSVIKRGPNGEASHADKIFTEINEELRSQYSLSYASSNPDRDGYFRKIEVRMKDKNQKAATRAGYYAVDR